MEQRNESVIYWTHFIYEDWRFCIATTSRGVCCVDTHIESAESLQDWTKRRFPGSVLQQDSQKMKPIASQLIEYLQGERENFTIPLHPVGTTFQLEVWHALMDIPYGTTRSYADVAQAIAKPTAVRAVGGAIGANPLTILIPCHRVIGKDGSLTGFGGGLEMKRRLLELESPNLFHNPDGHYPVMSTRPAGKKNRNHW